MVTKWPTTKFWPRDKVFIKVSERERCYDARLEATSRRTALGRRQTPQETVRTKHGNGSCGSMTQAEPGHVL